jgi:thymidylate synthase (FAD)
MDRAERVFWANGIKGSIRSYQEALAREWKPQEARGFLPNDLKTEIVVTMNLRSLLNFFKLRTAPSAHPDMQVIARKMLDITWGLLPLIFADNMDTVSAQWPIAAQEKP